MTFSWQLGIICVSWDEERKSWKNKLVATLNSEQLWLPALGPHRVGIVNSQCSWWWSIDRGPHSSRLNCWQGVIVFSCVPTSEHTNFWSLIPSSCSHRWPCLFKHRLSKQTKKTTLLSFPHECGKGICSKMCLLGVGEW